jgi:hypothetical protein
MSPRRLGCPERGLQTADTGLELVLQPEVLGAQCLGPSAVDEVTGAKLQEQAGVTQVGPTPANNVTSRPEGGPERIRITQLG